MTLQKNSFWLRGWARFCDYCLLFLVLGVISLFLPLFYDPHFYIGVALTIPLVWIPLEALFLSRFGTTIGKTLFGIRVANESGKPLSFPQALKRAAFIPRRPGLIVYKQISLKRKFFGLLLTLGCLSMGLFGNMLTQWGTGMNQGIPSDGWVKFESDKADFEVYFPKEPNQESKQIILPTTGKVLDYEEVSHEEEKVHYSVTHMTIPRKWKLAGDVTLLKLTLDSIVKHSSDTELINKKFIPHQGHRALEYHMKQDGKDVIGRLIIVGNIVYKLTMTCAPQHAEIAAASPFLDSFVAS